MNRDILTLLDQTIKLEEKFLPKFAAGTSQHSLGDLRDCKFLLPWYNKEKSEANEAGVLCP